MNEQERLEKTSAYVDGEMSGEEREAFEALLAEDDALRAEVDGLRRLERLLGAAPRPAAPPGFAAQAVKRARSEAGARILDAATARAVDDAEPRRFDYGVYFSLMAKIAAGIVIVAGVAIGVYSFTRSDAPRDRRVALQDAGTADRDTDEYVRSLVDRDRPGGGRTAADSALEEVVRGVGAAAEEVEEIEPDRAVAMAGSSARDVAATPAPTQTPERTPTPAPTSIPEPTQSPAPPGESVLVADAPAAGDGAEALDADSRFLDSLDSPADVEIALAAPETAAPPASAPSAPSPLIMNIRDVGAEAPSTPALTSIAPPAETQLEPPAATRAAERPQAPETRDELPVPAPDEIAPAASGPALDSAQTDIAETRMAEAVSLKAVEAQPSAAPTPLPPRLGAPVAPAPSAETQPIQETPPAPQARAVASASPATLTFGGARQSGMAESSMTNDFRVVPPPGQAPLAGEIRQSAAGTDDLPESPARRREVVVTMEPLSAGRSDVDGLAPLEDVTAPAAATAAPTPTPFITPVQERGIGAGQSRVALAIYRRADESEEAALRRAETALRAAIGEVDGRVLTVKNVNPLEGDRFKEISLQIPSTQVGVIPERLTSGGFAYRRSLDGTNLADARRQNLLGPQSPDSAGIAYFEQPPTPSRAQSSRGGLATSRDMIEALRQISAGVDPESVAKSIAPATPTGAGAGEPVTLIVHIIALPR